MNIHQKIEFYKKIVLYKNVGYHPSLSTSILNSLLKSNEVDIDSKVDLYGRLNKVSSMGNWQRDKVDPIYKKYVQDIQIN